MQPEKTQPYEVEIPVLFADCDRNGQWKPAAAFQYLGEAAGRHADLLGWGYSEMLAEKVFWVLSRIKICFWRYPLFGEKVIVRTWPKGTLQKVFFARDYEVLDANGQELITASSLWLLIHSETRRMLSIDRFNASNIQLDLPPLREDSLSKLNLAPSGPLASLRTVNYSDIDLLGHVNNGRYIEWLCDLIPYERFDREDIESLQVNFERELRAGQQVALHEAVLENGKTSYFEGFEAQHNLRSFEVEMRWRKRV